MAGKRGKGLVSLVGAIVVVLVCLGGVSGCDAGAWAHSRWRAHLVKKGKSMGMEQAVVNRLHVLDPRALTPQGVIRSYEIDYSSIREAPVLAVDVYVNGDKNLSIHGWFHPEPVDLGNGEAKHVLNYGSDPSDALEGLLYQRYGFIPGYTEGSGTRFCNEEYRKYEAEWKKRLPEIYRSMPSV